MSKSPKNTLTLVSNNLFKISIKIKVFQKSFDKILNTFIKYLFCPYKRNFVLSLTRIFELCLYRRKTLYTFLVSVYLNI